MQVSVFDGGDVHSPAARLGGHAARIPQLFWAWNRSHGDLDALRRLHAAVGDLLEFSGWD